LKIEAKKKGTGSFCIPVKAIDILLLTGKDAKWLIPVYLKLAAHTDETALYTTAGHSSIRKTLRRNKPDSIGFIVKLRKLKLIYSRDEWSKKTGEVFDDNVAENRKVRHVLNDFKEDRVDMIWFNRGLVDGHGEVTNSLRRLADCGADAARMFLYFHRQLDQDTFQAFNPNTTIYKKYEIGDWQAATNYMIKEWNQGGGCMTHHVLKRVFPEAEQWVALSTDAEWQDKNAHWEAVGNLEAAGFIYETAVVVSTPLKKKDETPDDPHPGWDYANMRDMSVVYELANHDRFATNTGDLHESILGAVKQLDSSGYSPGSVYSILPTGINHSVIGLYKPRYAVTNTRNAFVAEGIENRKSDQEQAKQWLGHFIKTKGLDSGVQSVGENHNG
jgi:hypothetical protein